MLYNKKFLLRAVGKDGKSFDLELSPMKCSLTFMLFHKFSEVLMPKENCQYLFKNFEWIPRSWTGEVYPQFIDPDGIIEYIQMIGICKGQESILNILNTIVDEERRRTFAVLNEDYIEATAGFINPSLTFRSQPFDQHEMSADFHMGYFSNDDPLHDPMDIKILKNRGRGKVNFPELEPDKQFSLVIGSEEKIPEGLDEISPTLPTIYNIWADGKKIGVTNDISWMKEIHENSLKDIFVIPNALDCDQATFDLVNKFTANMIFKISAHPANEPIEKEDDAKYSVFWSLNNRVIHYRSL